MNRIYAKFLYVFTFLLTCSLLFGQLPELIYYQFEGGDTSVANLASSPVGNNPAPILGGSMIEGGTGQFGLGLLGFKQLGNVAHVSSSWIPTLGLGSWTISLYLDNTAVGIGPTISRYLFGAPTTGIRLRAFGNDFRLEGDGLNEVRVINAAAPGKNVTHFVYDAVKDSIMVYLNGVFDTCVDQSAPNINSGANGFRVGGYANNTGLDSLWILDEFKMYNRALSAAEIDSTWDVNLIEALANNFDLSFGDPCSCGDPRNCVDGGITYFHDTLALVTNPVDTGLNVVTVAGTDIYSAVPCFGGSLIIIPAGIPLVESPPGSGIYKVEIWRPSGATPTLSVSINGSSATAVPRETFEPVCNQDDCLVESIPTLGQWGIILLSLILLIVGIVAIKERVVGLVP